MVIAGVSQVWNTSSLLLTCSWPFSIWFIRPLNKLQMLFTCVHSHRRCFEVSVMLHLGYSSVTVILYFFILTCVKKSLWISLKYIFLSFGFFAVAPESCNDFLKESFGQNFRSIVFMLNISNFGTVFTRSKVSNNGSI